MVQSTVAVDLTHNLCYVKEFDKVLKFKPSLEKNILEVTVSSGVQSEAMGEKLVSDNSEG